MTTDTALPEKLQSIVDLFRSAPKPLRLQALLEYSKKLPPLPEKYAEHPEFMQPVPECASPFFLVTEAKGDGVEMFFKVPEEAPTVRGYAGILAEGLSGSQPRGNPEHSRSVLHGHGLIRADYPDAPARHGRDFDAPQERGAPGRIGPELSFNENAARTGECRGGAFTHSSWLTAHSFSAATTRWLRPDAPAAHIVASRAAGTLAAVLRLAL